MPSNHLEDLVAEWYEFNGYFVRRNVPVGKRPKGGYECELDIVGFNPTAKHLVHIEPSLDADSWEKREERFSKKFLAGRKYIPSLFAGFEVPQHIEQIAIFVFASKVTHKTIGGGRVMLVKDLVSEIAKALRGRRLASSAIPEHLPLMRTLQFVVEYWEQVKDALGK
jgi:hypothetical protein